MKNHQLIYLLLAVMLVLLSACESGGVFKVHNRCSFPAYVSVDSGPQITLPAGASHEFPIDTDTESFFSGKVETEIKVRLIGETFSLFDEDEAIYTDSTTFKIGAGDTRNAFLNPNRASVKVTNNSNSVLPVAEIWQHTSLNHIRYTSLFDIPPGESKFARVDFAVPNAQYYYQVIIPVEDGNPLVYGDTSNVLANDQQFLVEYPGVGKN